MKTLLSLTLVASLLFMVGCPCEETADPPDNDISLLINDIDSDFQALNGDIQRLQADLDASVARLGSMSIETIEAPSDRTSLCNAQLPTAPILQRGCFGSV